MISKLICQQFHMKIQSCSHDHSPGESETSISMAKEHEGMPEVVTFSTESTTEACDETDKVSDINIVVDEIQPKHNEPPDTSITESMSTTEKDTRGTKRSLPVDFESQFDWLYCRQKA